MSADRFIVGHKLANQTNFSDALQYHRTMRFDEKLVKQIKELQMLCMGFKIINEEILLLC